MTGLALRVRGLQKSYDAPVLRGVDLDVPDGALAALLGPSGEGKTTLLRLVAGFDRADAGTVEVGGRLVEGDGSHVPPERRRIGVVPQEGALFPHLSVARNVGYGLPRDERDGRRVDEVLELVGLAGLGRRMPHELSGGQQQRVAVARALAPSPALVLLDEPFSALDAGLRAQVRSEVRAALKAAEASAVLVTHDQQEALSVADVVAVMRDGRVVQAGDPVELYRRPVDVGVATFVGEAVLLSGVARSGAVDTALGRLAAPGTADGPCTVVLRPEQLEVGTEGAPGVVRDRAFYGHDGVLRLELADGTAATARVHGHLLPPVGAEVRVRVVGPALAYPA